MARPRRIDPRVIEEAQKMASSATTLESLRTALAVLLPVLLNATLEQTASVLGVGRATVHRLQRRLRCLDSPPSQPRTSHGGRRHALMSLEEERAFLAPWEQASLDGSMLVASPLRAALSQELGRPVAASVVYRMLERHEWRKVAPDTRHPKSDAAVQEEWKKTARNAGSHCPAGSCQRTTAAPDVSG